MDEHNTTKVTVSSSEVWYSVKVNPILWLQYGWQSVDRAVKKKIYIYLDVIVLNTLNYNYRAEQQLTLILTLNVKKKKDENNQV